MMVQSRLKSLVKNHTLQHKGVIMFILFWIVLCVIIGSVASSMGRSGFGWFMLSVLLSPIIGAVALLCAGRKV